MRLFAAFLMLSAAAWAQEPPPPPPPAQDVAWPRQAKGSDGTVVLVYQPQVETWTDNQLRARTAVAVTRPGEKEPVYGVLELAAQTQIDKASDIAILTGLRITKSSFPGATEEEVARYLATLRGAVTRSSWPVSAQALQAHLAVTQARSKQKAQPVKNDPPVILFRTTPSLLVVVDGEPALRPVKDSSMQRVINTTALILKPPMGDTHYLWALGKWWEAPAVAAEWKPAASAPPSLDATRAALD